MKKFFVIAMAAMSLTVVSCKKVNVEEQAKVYAEKVIAAQESGDEAAIAAANKEMEDFANGKLNADEQAAFKAAIEKIYADYAAKKTAEAEAEAAEAAAAAEAEVADSTAEAPVEAVEE